MFEVPEGARIDLDARSYVEREMLRDPAFRRDGEVPKKLRPKRKPLPSTQMAVAKAQGCSSEKAARRYIKDFGYLHGIGAEPDDFDAFHGDCIQNLPDGRQELWRAGRDFFPDLSSSESHGPKADLTRRTALVTKRETKVTRPHSRLSNHQWQLHSRS